MRAVIADDLELVRLNLRHYLEQVAPKAEIQEVDCLGDLLGCAGDTPVDLILMDLKMPGMEGPGSVAHVRAAFPAAAIVVVSGHADEDAIVAVKQAGANAYISKLTRGEALRTALREFCTP